MQVNPKKNRVGDKGAGRLFKIILFWTIFLFIIFLGKRIFDYPKDNLDFIVKNLLSFAFTVILSGIMLHYFRLKALKLSIPIIWLLTILLIFL